MNRYVWYSMLNTGKSNGGTNLWLLHNFIPIKGFWQRFWFNSKPIMPASLLWQCHEVSSYDVQHKTALLMLHKSCILTPSLERHTKSNVAAPRFHTTQINLTEKTRFSWSVALCTLLIENSARSTKISSAIMTIWILGLESHVRNQ